jgi:hypothetical protein
MDNLHSVSLRGRQLASAGSGTSEGDVLPSRLQIQWLSLGLLMLVSALASGGSIQKCVDAQGKVSFTDKPCQSTEKATVIKPTQAAPLPTSTQTSTWKKVCDADRLAMREKTVPIKELEQVKNRIATCLYLQVQEAAAAHAAREASESRAEFARKSPTCQALFTEVSALQAKLETPEQIQHYIERTAVYERTCP